MSGKTHAEQTEGIEKSELDRRKAAGECQRCAWPGDRKGAHKTMHCVRWAKKEVGTAPFPKAKEYQKLQVGAYDQEEDLESEIDLYTTDDEDEESNGAEKEDEPEHELQEEEDEPENELQEGFSEYKSEQEESVSPEKNW
jgi:hypothetical protein